jgi:rod shape-determining protein MreB
LKWLRREGSWSADIGLDLGSWRCRRVVPKGPEQSCATAVLWDLSANQPVEIGDRAQALMGRHPAHWSLLRPIRQGVLADFDAAEHLCRHLLGPRRGRPNLLVAAPAQAGEVELQVVCEMLKELGAGSVCLVPSSACVALAAGHSPLESVAVAVLDLGYHLMQASVFSRGTAVHHLQYCDGAQALMNRLQEYFLRRHWLAVGQSQLEQVLPQLSALGGQETFLEVRGKDLQSGLPRTLMVAAWELERWVDMTVAAVVQLLSQLIEETPPELLPSLLEQGVFLAGGVSALEGLDSLLQKQLSLPVHRLAEPERACCQGLTHLLQDASQLEALVKSQALAGRLG